jgi:signal transduction histidine kinase
VVTHAFRPKRDGTVSGRRAELDLLVRNGEGLPIGRPLVSRLSRTDWVSVIFEEDPEEKASRAAARERSHLARELHDVVAHSLSVMTVQAAGARRILEKDPARAAEAIGVIERSGREALVELRRLLAGLQPGDSGRAALEATPSLEDLPALMRQINRAGVRAELHIEGRDYPLPAEVDLCAYRLVQEALTNVVKHVGECRADVTARYARDAFEIEVRNDGGRGPVKKPPRRGGGNGLIGMKQRAALLGGEVEAGPVAGGGYRVLAMLPAAP